MNDYDSELLEPIECIRCGDLAIYFYDTDLDSRPYAADAALIRGPHLLGGEKLREKNI